MTGDPFKLASVLISDVEEPEAPTVVYGEVDGVTNVTLADAVIVLQIAAGGYAPTDAQKVAADVDGVPNITLADAVYVLQRAAGSPVVFPVEQ